MWWLELSRYAHIVRQMHFNAPHIYAMGPIVGARTRRIAMRAAVQRFTAIGIPAERVSLVLGFQSGPGKGGREGLRPTAAWLDIVKQDTLAARQVAGELGIGTVWSWGANAKGQLGDGSTTDRPTPVAVGGVANAVRIAAGGQNSMALRANGVPMVWGSNAFGELGSGTLSPGFAAAPTTMSSLSRVIDIAIGFS